MKPKSRQQIRLEAKLQLLTAKLGKAVERDDDDEADRLSEQIHQVAKDIRKWAERILN
jgi:hypothetical protein